MSTVRAFRGMTRAGTPSVLAYRGDLVTGAVTLIIQVVLAIAVWRSVYSGRAPVNGVDARTAVAALGCAFFIRMLPTHTSPGS